MKKQTHNIQNEYSRSAANRVANTYTKKSTSFSDRRQAFQEQKGILNGIHGGLGQAKRSLPIQFLRKKRDTKIVDGWKAYEIMTTNATPFYQNAFGSESQHNLEKETKLLALGNYIGRFKARNIDPSSDSYNVEGYVETGQFIEVTEETGAYSKKSDEDYSTIYDTHLLTAVQLLNKGKKVKFDSTQGKRGFNAKYWKLGEDNDGDDILILKAGTPALAVDELFAEWEKWSLDCIDFIQVARWFALRHTIGFDAFNKKIGNLSFKLSYHETTGLASKGYYEREGKNEPFAYKPEGEEAIATNIVLNNIAAENRFLRVVPTGARVMWTDSSSMAEGEDFENENTLKLGHDSYSAHPFGVLSLDELRNHVSSDEDENEVTITEAEYYRRYVFISEIEIYEK